ncbi:MAG: LytTR family DNA-binding domain-containing protein [Crocinitomicaceae bacterium]|nr:LytTR family DNA-binding domain-containing protein [Crocinitomicaceae bacterium]
MKVILVDDERLAREELKSLLKDFHNLTIIGEASNAQEGIELIRTLKPDLIFLDIQMPGMDGFEMLRHLDEIPKVIFVTAYDNFALRAFEVNALDYLLKPVDPDRLKEAVLKIQEPEEDFVTSLNKVGDGTSKLSKGDRVFIKDGEKCWFIAVEEIRMFESDGNYVKVYFDKSRALILRSLNSLEDRVDSKLFFRANRKFIINLNWIASIENWFNGGLQVTMKNGEKVEISRRQAIRFKELMSI